MNVRLINRKEIGAHTINLKKENKPILIVEDQYNNTIIESTFNLTLSVDIDKIKPI